MSELNTLDWILLAIMIIGFINGFRKGLVMELTTLLGLVGGLWLAAKGHGIMHDWIKDNTSLDGPFLPYLAFFAVFILVYIGFYLAGKTISKTLRLLMLGVFDRIGGGLFGAFKLFAFGGLFLTLLNHLGFSAGSRKLQGNSKLADLSQASVCWASPAIKSVLNDKRPILMDELLES
jgi:membrane protein required for colicin V production